MIQILNPNTGKKNSEQVNRLLEGLREDELILQSRFNTIVKHYLTIYYHDAFKGHRYCKFKHHGVGNMRYST